MKDQTIIIVLSTCYSITVIVAVALIIYYNNQIQRLNNYLQSSYKSLDTIKEWKNELLETSKTKSNKILELVNSMNILKNQNLRYSKICRRLYDKNYLLKFENNHLKEKIAELEKGKLKEKRGKR